MITEKYNGMGPGKTSTIAAPLHDMMIAEDAALLMKISTKKMNSS